MKVYVFVILYLLSREASSSLFGIEERGETIFPKIVELDHLKKICYIEQNPEACDDLSYFENLKYIQVDTKWIFYTIKPESNSDIYGPTYNYLENIATYEAAQYMNFNFSVRIPAIHQSAFENQATIEFDYLVTKRGDGYIIRTANNDKGYTVYILVREDGFHLGALIAASFQDIETSIIRGTPVDQYTFFLYQEVPLFYTYPENSFCSVNTTNTTTTSTTTTTTESTTTTEEEQSTTTTEVESTSTEEEESEEESEEEEEEEEAEEEEVEEEESEDDDDDTEKRKKKRPKKPKKPKTPKGSPKLHLKWLAQFGWIFLKKFGAFVIAILGFLFGIAIAILGFLLAFLMSLFGGGGVILDTGITGIEPTETPTFIGTQVIYERPVETNFYDNFTTTTTTTTTTISPTTIQLEPNCHYIIKSSVILCIPDYEEKEVDDLLLGNNDSENVTEIEIKVLLSFRNILTPRRIEDSQLSQHIITCYKFVNSNQQQSGGRICFYQLSTSEYAAVILWATSRFTFNSTGNYKEILRSNDGDLERTLASGETVLYTIPYIKDPKNETQRSSPEGRRGRVRRSARCTWNVLSPSRSAIVAFPIVYTTKTLYPLASGVQSITNGLRRCVEVRSYVWRVMYCQWFRLRNNAKATLSCPGSKFTNLPPTTKHVEVKCDAHTNKLQKIPNIHQQYDLKHFACDTVPEGKVKDASQSCGSNNRGDLYEIGYDVKMNIFYPLITVCFLPDKETTFFSKHILRGRMIKEGTTSKRTTSYFFRDHIITVPVRNFYPICSQLDLFKWEFDSMYKISGPSIYLAKGHLAPNADFVTNLDTKLTLRFINAIPQWQSINNGNWKKIEDVIRRKAKALDVDLTIWTGTFEVLELTSNTGTQKEVYLSDVSPNKNRIPVPKWIWKIVVDPNSNRGFAALTLNNPFAQSSPFRNLRLNCRPLTWIRLNSNDFSTGATCIMTIAKLNSIVPSLPHSGSGITFMT